MTKKAATVDELLKLLGGRHEAATKLGNTFGSIVIWKHRQTIPARHFLKHNAILTELNIEAAPSIWQQVASVAKAG